MPGENKLDWSVTALSNGSADASITLVEGQTRASLNDAMRGVMAAEAKERNYQNGTITSTGSANAQAFTSGVGFSAMPAAGMVVQLKMGFTNTASATLNMDGTGAITIKTRTGANLAGGELVVDQYRTFLWNGTNWIMREALAFSIAIQVFGASGTYTPTTGMVYCIIECLGGGGGGGGAQAGASMITYGGGGGSGAYARKTASAATIGASQVATVGAAGAGGAAAATGSAGGSTSIGSICIAAGGAGGAGSQTTSPSLGGGGAGGAAGSCTGDLKNSGNGGGGGFFNSQNDTIHVNAGQGGAGAFGGASQGTSAPPAPGAGSGGGGGFATNSSGGGNAGAAGYIVITEYVFS